jgi:diaminohydroxyphosphoribosylaminopyrimidine deaminase/5-amino-6-(5-phosphoribosylamino)uracil reductase
VHKWRSEEAAILVGTNTAMHDNPSLTNRLWNGNNPIRLVIDKQLKLPATMLIFDGSVKTVVFNFLKNEEKDGILFYKLGEEENIIPGLLAALYKLKIQSVLVEGGTRLLQSFINADCWDEARIITNESLIIGDGIEAPRLKGHRLTSTESLNNDGLTYYQSTSQQ